MAERIAPLGRVLKMIPEPWTDPPCRRDIIAEPEPEEPEYHPNPYDHIETTPKKGIMDHVRDIAKGTKVN